jgi:hypothetical protein
MLSIGEIFIILGVPCLSFGVNLMILKGIIDGFMIYPLSLSLVYTTMLGDGKFVTENGYFGR